MFPPNGVFPVKCCSVWPISRGRGTVTIFRRVRGHKLENYHTNLMTGYSVWSILRVMDKSCHDIRCANMLDGSLLLGIYCIVISFTILTSQC